MNRTFSSFLLLAIPALFLAACGDGGSSSTGGSGGSTGGTTASGGSTGGTTSMGGTTASGGTTSMGGTTGMGGTGGTITPGDGCTDAADTTVLMMAGVQDAIAKSAQDNLGAEPATKDCVKALGLSDPCTTCFDDLLQCTIMNCLTECLADPNSQACVDCRTTNCYPAFIGCSGLNP